LTKTTETTKYNTIRQHTMKRTRKLSYHKYDRVMRPVYKLLHPNSVHAYGHYTLRGFDSELN